MQRILKPDLIESFEPSSDPLQYAYWEGKSSADMLIRIVDYAVSGLDKPKVPSSMRLVKFDFSSAFLTVQHQKLILRCIEIRVSYWLLRLLISFLSGRSQYTEINGSKSDLVRITSGFPEGEVLSPNLFTMFTDDIRSLYDDQLLCKFSDDSSMAAVCATKEDVHRFQSNIDSFFTQCKEKGLMVNEDKTKEIIVDFTRNKHLTGGLPPTLADGHPVEVVSSFKLVGYWFSDDLKPSLHVSKCLSKANSRLFLLYKMRSIGIPTSMLALFYDLSILSVFDYVTPVYHHALSQEEEKRIQRVQKRARKCLGDLDGKFSSKLKDRRDKLSDDLFQKYLDCDRGLFPLVTKARNGLRIPFKQPHLERTRRTFVPAQIKKFNSAHIRNPIVEAKYSSFVSHY
jgi:hypothetical protein